MFSEEWGFRSDDFDEQNERRGGSMNRLGLNGGYEVFLNLKHLEDVDDGIFFVLLDKIKIGIMDYCFGKYFIELDDIYRIIEDVVMYHIVIDDDFYEKFRKYELLYKRAFFILGLSRKLDVESFLNSIIVFSLIFDLSRQKDDAVIEVEFRRIETILDYLYMQVIDIELSIGVVGRFRSFFRELSLLF